MRRFVVRLLGLVLLGLLAWIGWKAITWPDPSALARSNPKTTAFIERYRSEQRKAGHEDRVSLAWTSYAAISPHVKRAVLVAEDINFFSHRGFDLGEIENAVHEALDRKDDPRGASTITQQLAKNLWLTSSRSPVRKLEEAILAWQIERSLDKKRTLELYLNVVELGEGIYGVGSAAQRYFGKSASELDEEEAAQLAASLPNPRSWHPGSRSRGYARHVERIRRRMDKASFLWKQI
jgi:monofunctional biosynthetic peptidoglycan transglycosylase